MRRHDLHCRIEDTDDGDITFSADLPKHFATVESGFGNRIRQALGGYIAAAGLAGPGGRLTAISI
ncbi:hypothetical protein OHC50_04300 [Paenarthrobacter ilicis]|uniref:hypothetical protein n=1 Tax=Paenarthrobacter ilicis TaxID=43665 RepID=UPI00300B5175